MRRRLGWAYAHAVAEAVFPQEKTESGKPEEDLIRGTWYKWYKENPDPAGLDFQSPVEYFNQWCDSHPREAGKLKEFMAFGTIDPTQRSFGIRPQEYCGQVAPVSFSQLQEPQVYVSSNSLIGQISQMSGALYQVAVLAMVARFAGQCMKTAAS